VINECKTQLKKRKPISHIVDHIFNHTVHQEEVVDLKMALQSLSPSDRVIVHMKYYLGCTFTEIAEAMGMPEGTVKTKLYQTLKLLKSKLALQEV
jgi:RNA polymerase sigma-70 factor (ECF subfamily)